MPSIIKNPLKCQIINGAELDFFNWNISQKQIGGKSLWSDETTEEGSVSCYVQYQFLRSETGHHNKMDTLVEKGMKFFCLCTRD